MFFVNAVLYANLVPRLPEVKAGLDLSNAGLGGAVAAMPVGALLAGLLAPAAIRRLGSARVAAFGLVVLGGALVGVPLSGTWLGLAAVMLLVGAVDAVVDVAQNAHGFRVQRLYRRSVVNSFHGLWSVGAVAGGVLGSVAAGLAVPLTVHLVVSAVLSGGVALAAYRFMLDGPEDAERAEDVVAEPGGPAVVAGPAGAAPDAVQAGSRAGVRTVLLLAALGALAACGAFVEDAGSTWGALYLREELGTTAAVGGLAFVSLQVAMTVGRLTGDRVVDRFGQQRVALAGGVLITAGTGGMLALPSVTTTVVGFALAGLGVATLIPAVMHTADEIPGLPAGVGLTVVSWLLRVGFLVSPALIGLVADATDLRVALTTVVAAGIGVLLLGHVLHPHADARPTASHPATTPPGSAGAAPV
ncbi:MFS transporter [Aquipuribacter sp. MA13-6]|uniref:MFS transporter n=1 Tax=unclassified Aquipuribacter TaxID=2635084 RepID=UPI003EEE6E61